MESTLEKLEKILDAMESMVSQEQKRLEVFLIELESMKRLQFELIAQLKVDAVDTKYKDGAASHWSE